MSVFRERHGDDQKRLKGHGLVAALGALERRPQLAQEKIRDNAGVFVQVEGQASSALFFWADARVFDVLVGDLRAVIVVACQLKR